MNDRKKWIERAKTAAIVLLSCSAVILLSFTGLVTPASLQALRPDRGEALQETVMEHTGSAPLVIAVNLGDGLHHGVKYDAQSLQSIYSGFSVVLGEALASAGEPAPVSRQQWEQAVDGKSVYMDFAYPMPLANLAGGLGVQMDSSGARHWAARLCLASADEGLCLLYCSGGEYFSCDTALRGESLNISEELVSNGAVFAWETADGGTDPDFLILADMPEIPALNAVNTIGAAMEDNSLLTRVGMNAVIASRYPESDGSTVYVEGESTLRVSSNGAVSYHYYVSDKASPETVEETEAVETAWIFAESTVGAHCGSAQLQLKEAYFDSVEGLWCVEFGYAANGIPVQLSRDQSAARVYVLGDTILAADLTFRSFENGEGFLTPLPDKQAFAAMLAARSEARLTYFEGAEGCSLQWEKMEVAG